MPMVRATFATSTNTAQPKAIRELVLHPRLRRFFSTVSDLPGDFKNAVGVVAKGSGVYAVELLRSGLNRFALAKPDSGVPFAVEGRGVNCRFSAESRC